jgi:hypothetical protein
LEAGKNGGGGKNGVEKIERGGGGWVNECSRMRRRGESRGRGQKRGERERALLLRPLLPHQEHPRPPRPVTAQPNRRSRRDPLLIPLESRPDRERRMGSREGIGGRIPSARRRGESAVPRGRRERKRPHRGLEGGATSWGRRRRRRRGRLSLSPRPLLPRRSGSIQAGCAGGLIGSRGESLKGHTTRRARRRRGDGRGGRARAIAREGQERRLFFGPHHHR